MHPLIPLPQFGSMPAPLSSTTPGEAWVWGDYVLTLQNHPKKVLDLMNEMSGRPAEDSSDLDYPFVVTVYYRKDRNPHGPSSQPILVVGLEQIDYARAMAKMGFDDDLGSEIPPGMGPPVLGVFTASSHLNMGRYDGALDVGSVRQRLFAVVADHIHPHGEPVQIGPISAIFGHPDTGWPAQKTRFTGFEYGILILGFCLLITGMAMILHPTEVNVARDGSQRGGLPPTFAHVSKTGVVVAGAFSTLAGIGFLAALFYRRGR